MSTEPKEGGPPRGSGNLEFTGVSYKHRHHFLTYSHSLPCLGSAWSPLLVSVSAAYQAPAGSG